MANSVRPEERALRVSRRMAESVFYPSRQPETGFLRANGFIKLFRQVNTEIRAEFFIYVLGLDNNQG